MRRKRDGALILEVVQGKRPWTDLKDAEITITFDDNTCYVDNPRRIEAVAGAADIAQGLLSYRSRPEELRVWARTVMAGSSFLEFGFEDHPDAEILLSALWDASFAQPVSETTWNTVEDLLTQEGREVRRGRAS